MTTTRDGAATTSSGPGEVGEASAFPGVRGLRWWAVLLLALVLTAGGVAVDVLRSGTLGVVFLAAYPGGCVLAAVLAQRRDIFVPMVQPPLLLAVSVPVAIASTGTLPSSGGMVSTALAIGAPLINGFPAMAATTLVCVVIGLVRMRVQRWQPPEAEVRREPVRSGPAGASGRERDDRDRGRARDDRERAREDRDRDRREADRDRARDERDRRGERDRGEAADRREQAERDRRRAQERARADRDREMAERDRAKRERREQELTERDRARRERSAKKRPKGEADDRPDGDRERLGRGAAEVPPGPTPRRSPLKGAGRDEEPPREQPPARDARSREERMRDERLREERGGTGRPPGVHPVRERPPERPPR